MEPGAFREDSILRPTDGRRMLLEVQVDESSLVNGRPVPAPDCPGKMGTPCPGRLQRRGCYWRADPNSKDQRPVLCFRCALCRKSFSVMPSGVSPYQRLSVAEAEDVIDEGVEARKQAPAEPSRKHTEASKRQRKRFFNAFARQRLLLSGLYSLELGSSVGEVWNFLKSRFGNMRSIAGVLHEAGLSFTGIHRTLMPWWTNHWAQPP